MDEGTTDNKMNNVKESTNEKSGGVNSTKKVPRSKRQSINIEEKAKTDVSECDADIAEKQKNGVDDAANSPIEITSASEQDIQHEEEISSDNDENFSKVSIISDDSVSVDGSIVNGEPIELDDDYVPGGIAGEEEEEGGGSVNGKQLQHTYSDDQGECFSDHSYQSYESNRSCAKSSAGKSSPDGKVSCHGDNSDAEEENACGVESLPEKNAKDYSYLTEDDDEEGRVGYSRDGKGENYSSMERDTKISEDNMAANGNKDSKEQIEQDDIRSELGYIDEEDFQVIMLFVFYYCFT